MKRFAAIIDLGRFDCCAIRRGSHSVEFHFYMHELGTSSQLEASATRTYPTRSSAAQLLYPRNYYHLRQEAWQILTIIQQQMLVHHDALEAGERVVVENPQLES